MSARALVTVALSSPVAEELAVVAALREQLEALRQTIAQLPDTVYCSSPSRASGSVGAQVRHCLDHVGAVVSAAHSSAFTYDTRARGTRVEYEQEAAIEELDRLCASLDCLTPAALSRSVRLRLLPGAAGPEVELWTTVAREVAFVTQHTIHHGAIIRVLIERSGFMTPEDFGYAPSTLRSR